LQKAPRRALNQRLDRRRAVPSTAPRLERCWCA
jgi:hypothetical protein